LKTHIPFLFFRKTITLGPEQAPLPPGYTLSFWRPGRFRIRPEGFPAMPFLVWGWCHALGVFATRDYGIMLIFRRGRLVHRTCLLPAHFRFPFMGPGDLQAAGIWTHPDHRGTGLGLVALRAVFHQLHGSGRTVWYMVREDNNASIRLAEKAGFQPWGRGRKLASPGLGMLGAFHITEGPSGRPSAIWPGSWYACSAPVPKASGSAAGLGAGPGRGRPPSGCG
jgi:RimJ/RimL family protein N-acetyltransferase